MLSVQEVIVFILRLADLMTNKIIERQKEEFCGSSEKTERNKLYLALDYACNNNCLFCVVDSRAKKNLSLSTYKIIAFLDALNATGEMKKIKFVEISGGEPTLRKDLFYILEYIRSIRSEMCFGMLSNGRCFVNLELTEHLSKFNLDWVYVPLHGHTSKLHDMQTQTKGSFEETLRGVHNLFDYGINTSLKTVISSFNYKKLPDIIEFVANEFEDCKIFTIGGIDIYGAAVKNKEWVVVPFSEAIPFIQAGMDIAKKYGMIVDAYTIPPCLFEKKYRENIRPQHKDLLVLKAPDMELRNISYQYGTSKRCCGCQIETNCSGAWFSYFKFIGDHELTPITKG